MLLAIDIGNTNITLGFFDGDALIRTFRLSSQPKRAVDEYAMIIKTILRESSIHSLDSAILSSVVPPLTPIFEAMCIGHFSLMPVVVNYQLDMDIRLSIPRPEGLGPDRIASAVAAYGLYGGPVVVVDFGTATTFSVVTENGEYIGGAIMPGIGMSIDALARMTAGLPEISLNPPERFIGDDTRSNLCSGIVFGHVGAVEKILKGIKRELGSSSVRVILTGGFSGIMKNYLRRYKVVPELTLEGLRMLYERNKTCTS